MLAHPHAVIVVGLDCATKDAAQKKVTVRTAAKYYTKRNKDLHGIFSLAGDLKSTTNAALPLVEMCTNRSA